MNTKQYKELLGNAVKMRELGLHTPILVWGESGIGKTSIPHQFAEERARETGRPFRCVVVKPGQADSAGDIVGMPEKVTYYPCGFCLGAKQPTTEMRIEELAQHAHDGHGKTLDEALEATKPYQDRIVKKQRFAITDIWPTEGEGILLIDEVNRAAGDIQNSLLGLIAERHMELTGYHVPPGFTVIGTANPPTADYINVQEMDAATVKRFVHVSLVPEPEEWTSFMAQDKALVHGKAARALNFFRADPKWIGTGGKGANPVIQDQVKPCPRQATNLVHLAAVMDGDLLYECAKGTLGEPGAVAFMQALKKAEEPVSAKQVLGNYTDASSPARKATKAYVEAGRHDMVSATLEDLLDGLGKRDEMLKTDEADNLVAFLGDLSTDMAVKFAKSMISAQNKQESLLYKHFNHLQRKHEGFKQLILSATRSARAAA